MEIVLHGRVLQADRPGGGITKLTMRLDGKIEGKDANGREVRGDIVLQISDRFANKLGLGDKYTVTVVTESVTE